MSEATIDYYLVRYKGEFAPISLRWDEKKKRFIIDDITGELFSMINEPVSVDVYIGDEPVFFEELDEVPQPVEDLLYNHLKNAFLNMSKSEEDIFYNALKDRIEMDFYYGAVEPDYDSIKSGIHDDLIYLLKEIIPRNKAEEIVNDLMKDIWEYENAESPDLDEIIDFNAYDVKSIAESCTKEENVSGFISCIANNFVENIAEMELMYVDDECYSEVKSGICNKLKEEKEKYIREYGEDAVSVIEREFCNLSS